MVERRGLPCRCRVTLLALLGELQALMIRIVGTRVVWLMARPTARGQIGILASGMALSTIGRDVSAG